MARNAFGVIDPMDFKNLGTKGFANMGGVSGGGGGHGPFGSPLGQVAGANPFADITGAGVSLAGINPLASQALESGFRGELAPGTVDSIQDAAAQWGASSGMPGFAPGSLAFNRGARDIGTTSEALKNQAFANYSPFVGAVSRTQTVSPEQQFEQNLQNEVNAHSPDPAQAASYAQSLFEKYLNSITQKTGQQTSQAGESEHNTIPKSYTNVWSGGPYGSPTTWKRTY